MKFVFVKFVTFAFVLLALVFLFSNIVFAQENIKLENSVDLEINYFYMTGCSACAQMKPFLEGISEKYGVKINSFEITSPQNSKLFQVMLDDYDVPFDRRGYVPTVFIKDNYFIGFSSQITNSVELIILNDLGIDLNDDSDVVVPVEPIDSNIPITGETTKINATILGILPISVHLAGDTFVALLSSTIILAFLDSLNICSITVLIFLIIYLVSIGSLKKVLKTGLVFTIVIYLFYFLFMLALSALISAFILEYGFFIRMIIVILCIFAGVLLIKDFFFYGKGLSLAVPKSAKPLLEKYLKRATLITTIIFALLASLVELPCTAVFPLVYSTILAEGMIVGLERIFWIALYNFIYVSPLLLIVFGTYFSWINIENVDAKIQKNKKKLKLLAGVMLVLIALYFALPFLVGL